jgi:hypothetical protein
LEHGLRDITAHCQAERERRMALEALVGVNVYDFFLTSCPHLDFLPLTSTPLFQMSPTGTTT